MFLIFYEMRFRNPSEVATNFCCVKIQIPLRIVVWLAAASGPQIGRLIEQPLKSTPLMEEVKAKCVDPVIPTSAPSPLKDFDPEKDAVLEKSTRSNILLK